MLTPTPSAWPYGYLICVGGANGRVTWSEMIFVECWAELLSGSEGAVKWLEISMAVMLMVCSKVGAGGSWKSGGGMLWWW